MPPITITKTLGLILLVGYPACAPGQTIAPGGNYPMHGEIGRPAVGLTPAAAGQYLPQEGQGALRSSTGVRPAAYEAPLAPDEPPRPQLDDASAVPLSPPESRTPLPLAPPGRSGHDQRDRASGLPSMVTVVGSLAVVLGIFFVVAWGMRRAAPPGATLLPGEVFEILGRASSGNRQQVQLYRCGNKLLLVSVTAAGAETLTEITDPVEVDRLAGLCQQAQPNSATEAFRQVFTQFAPRRPESGLPSRLFGKRDPADQPLAGAGVPATGNRLEDRHA